MAMTTGQLIAHKNKYYSAVHKQKILCLITQCICFLLSPLFRIFIYSVFAYWSNLFILDRIFLLLPLEVYSPLQISEERGKQYIFISGFYFF